MSWFSKATGIHWGNIGPVAGAIIGSIIPGVGTALGSAIGSGLGGLANHKNNAIGNIINAGAGIASAIPSVATGLTSALGGSGIGNAISGGLSKVGELAKSIPGLGGIVKSVGDAGGGLLSKIGSVFGGGGDTSGSGGGTDWGKIANLGLGAMDAYNAAQSGQKANSLLNKGIGQYNDNWNQGKATIMNPAPLPIPIGSQASNPFAAGVRDPQVQALQAYLAQQPQPPKP